jgi:hypothetical protein
LKRFRPNIVLEPEWRLERGMEPIDGGGFYGSLSQLRGEAECLDTAEPECSKLCDRGLRERRPVNGVALKVFSHDKGTCIYRGLRKVRTGCDVIFLNGPGVRRETPF